MFSVGHRSLLFRRGLFRKRVGWRGVKVSVSFVRAPPKFDAEKIVTSPRTLSLPQLWRALFPTSVGGASTGKQSEKVGRWVRSSVRSRRRRREMYRGRERRSAGTYFLPPSNYGSTVPWSVGGLSFSLCRSEKESPRSILPSRPPLPQWSSFPALLSPSSRCKKARRKKSDVSQIAFKTGRSSPPKKNLDSPLQTNRRRKHLLLLTILFF